jgi:hypothetical protein
MFNQDKPTDRSKLEKQNQTTSIARITPESPPILIGQWVLWEFNTLIHTNDIEFSTENLHDYLKEEIDKQSTPIDLFLSSDAKWVIEGARGRAKVDKETRSRIVAKLRGSIHKDIQFIAGIDYFGNSKWANIQMMLLLQPEKIEIPDPPSIPREQDAKPILPNEAIIVLAVIAGLLIFSGNGGLTALGILGLLGALFIYVKSQSEVTEAQNYNSLSASKYQRQIDQWRRDVDEIKLEQEELIKHRGARSFKTDDLRVFRSVMIETTAKIVTSEVFDKGATLEDVSENTDEAVAPSVKDKLFTKAARFEG